MNLNRAMIIGNLTRDPETRTTPNGQTVTSFGVATNFVWTDANGQKQRKTEYHNIVAWRKLAEICAQYLHRGSKVYVEGRLQTREWDSPEGNRRQRTEIIAENMIMLDAKGANAPSSNSITSQSVPEEKEPTITREIPDAPSEKPKEADSQEIRIEDIPF